MKNPLVFFVGAAVMAAAALAGATVDRWQDWPSPVQTTAASPEVVAPDEASKPAGEPQSKVPAPQTETAEQAAPELRREQPSESEAEEMRQDPAVEPDEQVAEPQTDEIDNPEAIAEAPVDTPAVAPEDPAAEPERLAAADARELQPAAPSEPAAPEPEPETSAQPSFDVVRLGDDGSLVVAGLSAPGAEVTLLLDGEAIATDAANDLGAWLLMPDAPLPPGSHRLMVQARDADSGVETSGMIALAVPERPGDRARAAHGEPAQAPLAEEDVMAAAPEAVQDEEPARLEPDEPPPGEGEEEQVALAPLPEPDVADDAPVSENPEPQPRGSEPEEDAAVAPVPEIDVEPELERRDIPLALETVDYSDEGDIVFSGRADPGHVVRIYVDNRFAGETTADADGRWVFAGQQQIPPGRHTLRADLLDSTGDVFGRIILPFVRADGREVAALVESRREAAGQQEPADVDAPQAGEAKPEAEAEAPAVVDDVAPEPEPEAPTVTEDIAPEPDPEAPTVAEDIAPEPDPEAPAVADVAPEPDAAPEAPTVAEDVAPEPEPDLDAPAAADIAPEPEPDPESPAVARVEPEPEPEPEAAVVVDDVAPDAEDDPESMKQAAREPEEAAQVAAAEPERIEPADAEAAGEESAAQNGEPRAVAARPGHVVIQPGNNLWRISRVIYGRGIEYTAIYQANRDKIRDPDLIYPGQIFATPGVNPPKEIDPDWRRPLSPEELARQNTAE